jgi:hypothetical protein
MPTIGTSRFRESFDGPTAIRDEIWAAIDYAHTPAANSLAGANSREGTAFGQRADAGPVQQGVASAVVRKHLLCFVAPAAGLVHSV